MSHSLVQPSLWFRDRDFFMHDGRQLRRFRLSAPVQAFFFALTALLVGWSGYSAARLIINAPAAPLAVSAAGYSAEVAKLAAETDRRVQVIEERQLALAAALASEDIDPAALKRLGFTPSTGGQGGPFDGAGDPTFKQLFSSWKKLDSLQNGAIAIPSEKPVRLAAFTSGYGVRSDPFKGGAAMHAGIDLSGPLGTPIYATAEGVVTNAGWNSGGYGNLIKIDHGRGIETRYGHLSSIGIQPGQKVTRGQLIGRMGSTGRSTGSHLHYEVRIDGRPVNPIPFMKSTDYLMAMKKGGNTHSMDQVALGGPTGGRK
ncbi:M23 family metallopeptidase [Sphingomonas sinipercae]|uniref:M23 family metallopeptidase n=2 Tax=Sphingomonas sinipercae TaxID=2714944 RepID=A0A6G7ZLT8_9SPHN|nr:M23 family metallopeptidase [Sphingomonas sinipercae]